MTRPARTRAQFGNRLRRLREDAGLNGKQLAARLGWAPSKVSRVETGQRTASSDDVSAWAEALGASAELTAELLEAQRVTRVEYERWQLTLRGGHGPRQRAQVRLETATTLLRAFEPDAIPGLLHTTDYARQILTSMTRLRQVPNDVEDAVQARLRRQEVLYDSAKQFQFVLTEAALRQQYGPPAVLRGQLDRLLTLADLDTVQLAVIPFGTELPVVLHGAFWLYDSNLVTVETYSAELALRDPEDVALHVRVFQQLWDASDKGRDVLGLVRSALADLASSAR